MKKLNKTVAKFSFDGKKYEVDQLLDTKWGNGTPRYYFDVFQNNKQITQFETHEGDDYVARAIEAIRL
jgi:predicted RNA-binding protein associated with RNAse of E/G family